MVRIRVAGGATAIFKMERRNLVGRVSGPHFVAVVTGNGHVRACQRKLGLAMPGNRKHRTVKVLNGVAAFAAIIVRSGGKLAGVNVFVAVHAVCELHVVDCRLAGREVALRAFHLGVLAFQRVVRACVFLHSEQRWFPAFDGMALRALSFFLAVCELASVNVLVAVGAIRERERLLEIAVYVTSGAIHRCMLSQQRVFRCRMIEGESGEKFFPSRGRVAGFATLLEGAFVRVKVTTCAGGEVHAFESRRPARHVGLMTLLACHLDVKARQRIARLGMIESLSRLPIVYVMAALAVLSELALVRINVAREAVLRKSEKRLADIFVFDSCAVLTTYIFRCVALRARDACVFAFQSVSGQLVVKLFLRGLPVNQGKIDPIVLQMAAHTVFPVGILHPEPRVIPSVSREMLRNLFVAIKALERRSAGAELVAGGALRRSGQRLMRGGKRAW